MASKSSSKRRQEKYKANFDKIIDKTSKGKTNKKHRKG